MTSWPTYDYLIRANPGEAGCPTLTAALGYRIVVEPRGWWVTMRDTDAVFVKMSGLDGLVGTDLSDLFRYDGEQIFFDLGMAHQHPNIEYAWIVRYEVAFANGAAQRAFDSALNGRLYDCVRRSKAA